MEMQTNEKVACIVLGLALIGILSMIQMVIKKTIKFIRRHIMRVAIKYLPDIKIKRTIIGIEGNNKVYMNQHLRAYRRGYYNRDKAAMIKALENNVRYCKNADRDCKIELLCPHCPFINAD